MKRSAMIVSTALLAGTIGLGVGRAAEPSRQPATSGTKTYAPDDTGVNARDRGDAAKTADQQSNDPADVRVTQEIRRAVTGDDSLSMNAHNVKIVTVDGVVTLRGPVDTPEERARIGTMAHKVAGVKRVENQLEVSRR